MPFEFVIDTQILVDVRNPECRNFDNAFDLIELILKKIQKEGKEIDICVDSNNSGNGDYDLSDINKNTSLIISEYKRKLGKMKDGDLAWQFLIELDKRGYIHTKSRRAPTIGQHKFILCHLHNKSDRRFVIVTCYCTSKILASDEGTDYTTGLRTLFSRKPLSIKILHCNDHRLISPITDL